MRDRYAVYVDDLSISGKTAQDILDNVEGVANVRVDEDIAGGFITLRNVASVVCIALIAILLLVSVFIISNTIKLTTFDRRDEIAIMKMVGRDERLHPLAVRVRGLYDRPSQRGAWLWLAVAAV